MLELLAPAGSMDALRAAVQNGADAVYLGGGGFHARVHAGDFSAEQLREAVAYCHIRGVRVHLTLNTLFTDRELPAVGRWIETAARCGVDAFIVQDLGGLRLCREIAPEVERHASTQMSVCSLDGVKLAARLGCKRVVVARELSADQLRVICRDSPVEIEVFGHGSLCMCYSGQCWFSAVVGRRSGNRGQCAQPCRLPYGFGRGGKGFPLSLRDNCLIDHLKTLRDMGAASIKLEGRMKRPEYVAVVTRVYRAALDGQEPGPDDLDALKRVFSRQGFTDGYFRGQVGPDMFGIRETAREDPRWLASVRASYENGERQCVPVRFSLSVEDGKPVSLTARDGDGHSVNCSGEPPETARNRPVTREALAERLAKTGGTPFRSDGVEVYLEDGLTVPARAVNALRRDALEQLSRLRGRAGDAVIRPFELPDFVQGAFGTVQLTVQLRSWEQLTPALVETRPAVVYLPLSEIVRLPERAAEMCETVTLAAVLPRIVWDSERAELLTTLKRAYAIGVRDALIGNPGQIDPVNRLGFRIRGDFGLNVFNSLTVDALRGLGLVSATVSFEMLLAQVRDLDKSLPLELIVYGRLPLMITENCLIKNHAGKCVCHNGPTVLTDRMGAAFPVLPDPGSCRSVVYNGKRLFLLDRLSELDRLGLRGARLLFTDESPAEVDAVLNDWRRGGGFDENQHTRGLYFRGVE